MLKQSSHHVITRQTPGSQQSRTLPREEPLLVNHLEGAICGAPVSQAGSY